VAIILIMSAFPTEIYPWAQTDLVYSFTLIGLNSTVDKFFVLIK